MALARVQPVPESGSDRKVAVLDRAIAMISAVLIGSHQSLVGPVTLTLLVPLALVPVWLPVVAPLRAKVVAILGICAILSGLALNVLAAPTHQISTSVTLAQIALILEVVLGAGTLVWVRKVVGSGLMAITFGVGIVVSLLIHGPNNDNVWKFGLFFPITVVVLGWCWWKKSFRIELLALLAIAAVSALNDSRSAASILITTFLILVWQRGRAALRLRSTALRVLAGIAVVGSISYFMMQAFILDGFLGQNTQERSEAQIRSAGSLLLGGRPEIGATIALLRASPWGYGIGVVPTVGDIYIAKTGMAAINYDPNNGYVERYMFGDGIEVHSVVGDLWLRCGVLGLAFALSMIGLVIIGSVRRLAADAGRALTTYLAIQVVWDSLFSPFYTTAAMVLMLAIGLLAGDRTLGASSSAPVPAPYRPQGPTGPGGPPGPVVRSAHPWSMPKLRKL